ncbi:MAG: hypothetical protein KKC20_25240 [Proteobacteria bacterium]|nr:hypothetical protein [Pseudomonadota bacterium]
MGFITRREGLEFTPTNIVLDFLNAKQCKILYRLRRQTGLQEHRDRAQDRAKGSSLHILEYVEKSKYPIVVEYAEEPQYKSFNPLFSPDGTRVLFNQTFGTTDIFVLPIGDEKPIKVGVGANPHWFVDQNTNKTHIVYRDTNAMFDAVPQPGKTFMVELDKNNQPSGNPVLISNFGYGGGISTDGRYLCTAFKLSCILDRQTGILSAPWGTVVHYPDSTNQCCCPSISPDDSGQLMVLRWPHERFSITDFTGNTRIHFQLPEGFEEWQTPEWSTHPNFCTASAMNKELLYNLFMININHKKYLQITSDSGYVHGHLWVGEQK